MELLKPMWLGPEDLEREPLAKPACLDLKSELDRINNPPPRERSRRSRKSEVPDQEVHLP